MALMAETIVQQLSATQLSERLKQTPKPLLLDVREKWEFELAQIPGALSAPMSEMTDAWQKLAPDAETILICHSGRRSQHVAHFLAEKGFTNLSNLHGGIDAWSVEVDPSVPRY